MADIDKITKIKLKAKESTSPVVPPLEPGEIRALTKSRLIGNISGGGSSGTSNVSPTLNLINFDTGEIRTTITEEEKTNLDKGLYDQIVVTIPSEEDETSSTLFFPTKLFTINQDPEKAFVFSQFKTTSDGSKISSIGLYILQVGAKNDNNEYPVTIVANGVCDIGGSGGSGENDLRVNTWTLTQEEFNTLLYLGDRINLTNKEEEMIKSSDLINAIYPDDGKEFRVTTLFVSVQQDDVEVFKRTLYDLRGDMLYIWDNSEEGVLYLKNQINISLSVSDVTTTQLTINNGEFSYRYCAPSTMNYSSDTKILSSKNGNFEWIDGAAGVIIRRF